MRVLFVLACCVCSEQQVARPRVYLGKEDTNNDFPFVVVMEHTDGTRICTCSLIAQNWLITVGHRVRSINTRRRIKYADFTTNETRAFSKIIKIFRHPSYFFTAGDEPCAKNDLALALIEKVPLKTFVKLSAIDYKGLLGVPVKYAAFGWTREDELAEVNESGDDLRALQVGEGVVIQCHHVAPMFGPALCMAPKCSNKKQVIRTGDAGAPVVYSGKLVGVIIGSEVYEAIAFATPVSSNLKWISDVMKNNS